METDLVMLSAYVVLALGPTATLSQVKRSSNIVPIKAHRPTWCGIALSHCNCPLNDTHVPLLKVGLPHKGCSVAPTAKILSPNFRKPPSNPHLQRKTCQILV